LRRLRLFLCILVVQLLEKTVKKQKKRCWRRSPFIVKEDGVEVIEEE